MIKRIYDLNFSKDHQFVIYKRISFLGFFISKTEIKRFTDVEKAVEHFKTLI